MEKDDKFKVEKMDLVDVKVCKPTNDYLKAQYALAELNAKQLADGVNSLVKGMETISPEIVLEDGTVLESMNPNESALVEVQKAEELQRKKREQYEQDRAFFVEHIEKKTRSYGEVREDYIKILHPYYREKFLAGIEKYGTIPAALKYMKDTYGLKVRGDVLRRMSFVIPAFKQEIEDALDLYQATLQMEMHRRAVDGTEKGIYHNGELIATERTYSDALLAKMVDTHNPEYKEAKQKDTAHGNTINVQIIKDFHNYKETK